MFICHGNICRSPMAEFMFRKMVAEKGLAEQIEISSSATSTEEIPGGHGNPVYPPARQELARHGIDCSGKRAVQLTAADYERYDMLIAMDSYNVRNIGRIVKSDPERKIWKLLDFATYGNGDNSTEAPRRLAGHDISDPWYTGDFSTTYADISIGCKGLMRYLELKGLVSAGK